MILEGWVFNRKLQEVYISLEFSLVLILVLDGESIKLWGNMKTQRMTNISEKQRLFSNVSAGARHYRAAWNNTKLSDKTSVMHN